LGASVAQGHRDRRDAAHASTGAHIRPAGLRRLQLHMNDLETLGNLSFALCRRALSGESAFCQHLASNDRRGALQVSDLREISDSSLWDGCLWEFDRFD